MCGRMAFTDAYAHEFTKVVAELQRNSARQIFNH